MGLLRHHNNGQNSSSIYTSTRDGEPRILLQRANVTICFRRDPNIQWPGYLVLTERGQENIFFFSTKKLSRDDHVQVTVHQGDEEIVTIVMTSCHDQVSSGRIMRESTDESNRFPARIFYRCYGRIESVVSAATETTEIEDTVVAAAMISADEAQEATAEPPSAGQVAAAAEVAKAA